MAVTVDSISDRLQNGVKTLLGAQHKPPHRVKDMLHGTPLHHPAHPALVSIPIGALTVAALFDGLWLRDRQAFGWAAPASRAATLIGGAGALASAATGLADWSDSYGEPRRLGFWHGLGNLTAISLFTASSVLRMRRPNGESTAAAILGFVGAGMITVTGYIGGEIVYKYGMDVNHTAFEEPPPDFVAVIALADLPQRQLTRVMAGAVPVVLLRDGEKISAIDATCTHAGGPLDEGQLDGNVVTCPWHGSRFCVTNGKILDGPATVPAPRYDVRVRDGQVEVKRIGV